MCPNPALGAGLMSQKSLRSHRSSMLGDLCHSASLYGSVDVGNFYYRKQTLNKVSCVFVLLSFPPCGICDRCILCVHVCVCVCVLGVFYAPGDDILIFVNFRLEVTVSQSPTVKGKNKRHVRMWAHTHTKLHKHKKQAVFVCLDSLSTCRAF